MKYTIHKTEDYTDWLSTQSLKTKVQISERLDKIALNGHFGNHRYLNDIWELKWENGRRIYYAHFPDLNIVLLLGGSKNDQKKDIRHAKKSTKTAPSKPVSKKRMLNLNHPGLTIYKPMDDLLNETLIKQAILECFENNDFEGILEVIKIHLEAKKAYGKPKKVKQKRPISIKKSTHIKAPTQASRANLIAKSAKRSPR